MTRVWDQYLTEQDKLVFQSAGFGAHQGFGQKPALLVVDITYSMTGDRPEPILESIKRWKASCGEISWPAIAKTKTLIAAFRAKNLPIIYTAGGARTDRWDSGSWRWKNSRPSTNPAAAAGQPASVDGNDIVAEIAPEPQDQVILKLKPSAFFETHLRSVLTMMGCDSLIVVGTSTSGCVRATVIDAFSSNFRVTIAEDCCFDRAEISHAVSLFDMHAKYADVLDADTIIKHISGLADDLYDDLPTQI